MERLTDFNDGMERPTDRKTDRQMGGLADGQIFSLTSGQMDKQTER